MGRPAASSKEFAEEWGAGTAPHASVCGGTGRRVNALEMGGAVDADCPLGHILELTSGSYSYKMNRPDERKSVDQLVLACEHSPLALACTRTVLEQLEVLHPKLAVEIRPVRGHARNRRLKRGTSFLLRSLERKSANAVVVPVGDLPDDLPAGLQIVVVGERLAPFQALVSSSGTLLDDLPEAGRIGVRDDLTRFQLADHRPDLNSVSLRRSLAASLKRVKRGQLDGLIAPVVELELLGLQGVVAEVLDGSMFLPAPGRGGMALVVREGDRRCEKWLEPLEDAPTRYAVEAERALVREMNGVNGTLGALAQVSGKGLQLEAALWSSDGQEVVRDSLLGEVGRGAELGRVLAEKLYDLGADRLLRRGRRSSRTLEKTSSGSGAGD